MADDTVYTVIERVDTNAGGPTSSDYEKNGVVTTPSGAPADDTAYSFTDGLDTRVGSPNSSFYEKGLIYQDLTLADTTIAAITAEAVAAANSQIAAAASAALALFEVTQFLASPTFTGVPSGPTAAPGTNTTQLATTAFDTAAVAAEASVRLANDNSETAARIAADSALSTAYIAADVVVTNAFTAADALKAPLASPALTGVPVAPTAAPGTNTTQLATTAFVDAARVILVAVDALKAPLASPALTGTPTAPTATAGTNTTQLATTAYADAINTLRIAAEALKAPLASPALTGTPTVPTATALTNTTQAASTAYADAAVSTLSGTTTTALALKAPLASPTFTGVPAAPTATVGTNTTQLATTAFVLANASSAGVSSIAGNTGAFTLGGQLSNATNVLQVLSASKSDQQTGTSNVVSVAPLHQQDHDSAAKAWVYFTVAAGVVTVQASYNVTSVSRTSAGVFIITFTTAFASANYAASAIAESHTINTGVTSDQNFRTASVFQLDTLNASTGAPTDPAAANATFFGRQ